MQYVAYTARHNDPLPVFGYGKAMVFGGGYKCALAKSWALIVCLEQAKPDNVVPVTFFGGANKLFPEGWGPEAIPTIHIPIPDRGTPRFNKAWWHVFATGIKMVEGDVLFHCTAGVGRTGMMLSALLGVGPQIGLKIPKKLEDPVKFMRDTYDERAVESEDQMNYLKALGIETVEMPSDKSIYHGHAGSYTYPAKKEQPIGDDTKPLSGQGSIV